MGNSLTSSSPSNGVTPSPMLKWKTGPIDGPLPYPTKKLKTYDDLFKDDDFRFFIYNNLQNEYLINALLEIENEDVFCDGIDLLTKQSDTDDMNTALFEKILATDIKYEIGDILKFTESLLQTNIKLTPFFKAYHKRMALLRAFTSRLTEIRVQARSTKSKVRYNACSLTSREYPQILPLDALKNTGLALLKAFPAMYSALKDNESLKPLLLAPIEALCGDIAALASLSLYPSWAPRQPPPKQMVPLSADRLFATGGGASKAIDSNPAVCWSCSSSRAMFGISFEEPTALSCITVHWATSPLADCCAPECLIIYARNNKNECFLVQSIDMSEHAAKNDHSWFHTYELDDINVVYLELQMKGFAAENNSSCTRIYHLNIQSQDYTAKCIDSLDLCYAMQERFFEIARFPELENFAAKALLSLIRASGSLGLSIRLIKYSLLNKIEGSLASSPSLQSLLDSMDRALREAEAEKNALRSRDAKITFDDESKSETAELLEENSLFKCPTASLVSPAYAQLSCVMSEGTWSWEFTIMEGGSGSDACAMGVGLRPVVSASKDTSDLWLIACSNYSSTAIRSERLICMQIHPNDICHFTFDSGTGSLSLKVNTTDHGVIFRDVPRNVSPVVVFYEDCSCRLLTAKQSDRPSKAHETGSTSSSDDSVANVICISDTTNQEEYSLWDDLLIRIDKIARVRLGISEGCPNFPSIKVFEYPFALEVSQSVITDLFDLIELYMADSSALTASRIRKILSLLTILETQFSHLDDTDCALEGYSNSTKSAEAVRILNVLMESSNKQLRIAAAKVFARGSPVFLPNVAERVSLISSLLSSCLPLNKTDSDGPKIYLLSIISERLFSHQGVLSVISLYASSFNSDKLAADSIMKLCELLIDLLAHDPITFDENSFLKDYGSIAFTFLVRFFEMSVMEASSLSSPDKEAVKIFFRKVLSSVVDRFCRTLADPPFPCLLNDASQDIFKEFFLFRLLHPMLHVVTLLNADLHLVYDLHAHMTLLLKMLAGRSTEVTCSVSTLKLYNKSLPITLSPPTFEGGDKGWIPLNAFLEVDSTFILTEGGAVYESTTSSNTCAVANVVFNSPQRAAWEFELVSDSMGDECSLFGAAQIPLSSRCYSSSPDLWMRRSYNGYLYSRGRTSESNTMEKIHPGDIVRIEYDGRAGTLSFGINGSTLEVGFSDVSGAVSPSCGSYRSGVKIRLLKVEVFQSTISPEDTDCLFRSPSQLHWELDASLMQSRNRDTLCPIKEKKDSRSMFEVCFGVEGKSRVVSCRADRSVSEGIHEWSFEVQELSRSLIAFGVSLGSTKPTDIIGKSGAHDALSAGWLSDGSLWCGGILVSADFGKALFPLRKLTVVTMRLDLSSKTISFSVNGTLVGVAFTATNCPLFASKHARYSPGATVSSPFQAIKLCSSGFDGSIIFPTYTFLYASTASCFARSAASLISGPHVDGTEEALQVWLKSPLLVGGLDDHHLESLQCRSSWDSRWNGGQLSCQENDSASPVELQPSSSVQAFIDRIAFWDVEESESTWFLFESWLNEAVDKDQALLRTALERANMYSFPRAERPFAACMLKHAGLFHEAIAAVADLGDNKTPAPSNDMRSLWKRVRQLRVLLRQQKQQQSLVSESIAPGVMSSPHLSTSSETRSGSSLDFFLGFETLWFDQTQAISVYSSDYCCIVKSVGVDIVNKLLYIKFSVRGGNSSGPIQSPLLSTVSIGSVRLRLPLHQYEIEKPECEIVGCLRFELPTFTTLETLLGEEMGFTYGETGYSSAKLSCQESNPSTQSTADVFPSSAAFLQICDEIESKALFLLKLQYAGSADLAKSSGVRSRTPGGETGSSSSSSPTAASSVGGAEKWKKVVEFLRVHTSKREVSRAFPTDQIQQLLQEDENEQFSSNAALKACALFVTNNGVTPKLLLDILNRRNLRASYRLYSYGSLATALSFQLDKFCLQEILVFSKFAISNRCSSNHYLRSLEGCSSSTLKKLQRSFVSVFLELSKYLTNLIHACVSEGFNLNVVQKNAFDILSILLSLWFIHFSSRDFNFIHDSKVLRGLYQLSSFEFYESIVGMYVKNASQLISLKCDNSIDLKFYRRIYQQGTLVENLKKGILSGRDVIFNIYMLPASTLSQETKAGLGLTQEKILTRLCSYSTSDVTVLFHRVLSILFKQEEERKKEEAEELAALALIEKEKYDAEDAIIRQSGIPLFDASRKASDIFLEKHDQVAGISASRDSTYVCGIFATQAFDLSKGCVESGNYFEIRIDDLGSRDIGIGFGTLEHFQVTGQMPGWEKHSYGYHGDDGRKFGIKLFGISVSNAQRTFFYLSFTVGVNNTDGNFPLFEANDIIGCGIDFTHRSIFYTRNGAFLGTGFTDVSEDVLHPVFGFHGTACDQKIYINFGVEEFLYQGSQVVVNAKSLVERAARRLRTENSVNSSNLTETLPASVKDDSNVVEMLPDEKVEVEINETWVNSITDIYSFLSIEPALRTVPAREYEQSFESLRVMVETCALAMREVRRLGRYSRSLLKFFLVLICENDTNFPPSSDTNASMDMQLVSKPLLRGRSTFGTPKTETYGDGALLMNDICAFYVVELSAAAAYLQANRQQRGFFFWYGNERNSEEGHSDFVSKGLSFLDVVEVDQVIFNHLVALRSILSKSLQMKSALTSTRVVTVLLALFDSGSLRVRELAAAILRVTVVEILPEDIEFGLATSALTSSLMVSVPSTGAVTRITRKLPDSIVRILFEKVKDATGYKTSESGHSFGQGRFILQIGSLSASLLYTLLESSLYAELVSCFLTDTLRLRDDNGLVSTSPYAKCNLESVWAAASAACLVLSDFTYSSIKGGSLITPSGDVGTILECDWSTSSVSYTLSTQFMGLKELQISSEIGISQYPKSVSVDLSSFSQPLLPQLVSVLKQFLTLMSSENSLLMSPDGYNWRLGFAVTRSIAWLIQGRQDSVIDAIQYADVVLDIVKVGLCICDLDCFITSNDSLSIWSVCQARILELAVPSFGRNLHAEIPVEHILQTPATASVGISSTSTDCDGPEISNEIAVQQSAEQLASETGVEVKECVLLLEYFMHNVERTREYLLTRSLRADESGETDGMQGEERTSGCETLLKHADLQAEFTEDVLLPYRPYELMAVPRDAGNVYRFSDEEVVAEVSAEGISRIGQPLSGSEAAHESIVCLFDKERSVQFAEALKTDEVRIVRGIYSARGFLELREFLSKVDKSVVILHMRDIVLQMLLDGSINLESDAYHLNDWIKLIKLCSVTKHRENVVSNICKALLRAASTSLRGHSEGTSNAPLVNQITSLLLDNILASISHLMAPEVNGNDEWRSQGKVYSSPHPFVDDVCTHGSIKLPSKHHGCLLIFNQKSCTPSKLATFNIYFSRTAFENEIPERSFFGSQGSSNAFRTTFIDASISTIYFKFEALPGSCKPGLKMVPSDGHVSFSGNAFQRSSLAERSATGEDDTLFSFFNSEAGADDEDAQTSCVLCDSEYLSSGPWYFETTFCGGDVDRSGSLSFVKTGVVDSSFDCSYSKNCSWKGAFMMDYAGGLTPSLEPLSESANEHLFPAELQANDIIGCSFYLSSQLLTIQFFVNGVLVQQAEATVDSVGVKPAFIIGGTVSLKANFGASPYSFAPLNCKPVLCRPVTTGDNVHAWGYEFTVEPAKEIPYKVTRKFDLVWHVDASEGIEPLFIWRPKPNGDYVSTGDIATTSKNIPLGAILLLRELVLAPVDFERVCLANSGGLSIWRPLPPEGHVSVGDIYFQASDVNAIPPKDISYCIPRWAASKYRVRSKALYADKFVDKDTKYRHVSLWRLNNSFGFFRASQISDHTTCLPPDLCFSLSKEMQNDVSGEWYTEADVASKPSLSWACQVFEYLLESDSVDIFTRKSLFPTLIRYVSCEDAPNPFKLMPLIIRYIRKAAEASRSIDIDILKHLTDKIANMMTSSKGKDKRSFGHLLFSDLLVEVERYHLLASSCEAIQDNLIFDYSSSSDIKDSDKALACGMDLSLISNLFKKDSMDHKVRSLLSFYYSLDDISRLPLCFNSTFNSKYLSPELAAKLWLESSSFIAFEESSHPHTFSSLKRTISLSNVDNIRVSLDRRCDLASGCTLTLLGGESKFCLKSGDDLDASANFISFQATELEIRFEGFVSTEDRNQHWGWALLVESDNAGYDTHRIRVRLDDATVPLLSADSMDLDSKAALDRAECNTATGMPGEAVIVESIAGGGGTNDTSKVSSLGTEAALEIVFERGMLIEKNDVDFPFESDHVLDLCRGKSSISDDMVYVFTLLYSEGGILKSYRVSLDAEKSSGLVLPRCSRVTYSIHRMLIASLQAILKKKDTTSSVHQQSSAATVEAPSALATSTPEEAPPVGWTCAVCTLFNAPFVNECEVCANARPSDKLTSPVPIQVQWFCRACTLINEGTSSRCAACDVNRTAYEDASSTNNMPNLFSAHVDNDSSSSDDDEPAFLRNLTTPPSTQSRRPSIRGLGMPGKPLPPTDVVEISFRGSYTREQKFEIRLVKAMLNRLPLPVTVRKSLSQWNEQFDTVLLEHLSITRLVSDQRFVPLIPKQTFILLQATAFNDLTLWDVYIRSQLFKTVNSIIESLLPSLNLLNTDERSIGSMVRRYNKYIFLSVKQPILETAIEVSTINGGVGLPATLLLSNYKSIASKQNKQVDPTNSQNCFIQAFDQLFKKDSKVYKHIFSSDRVFQISFEDESGIDAGGVFREGMSRIVEDLFSEEFTLLFLCPNGKHQVHINTDKFIPNPKHNAPLHLHMFEFIGKLMGVSLRAKMCLPFDFPSLVWKALSGDELKEEDFRSFDAISYEQLMKIRDCDKDGNLNEDAFEELFDERMTFTCLGSDGEVHELCPNGKEIPVTVTTRLAYVEAAIRFRLHEFDMQLAAMRRGLADVLPMHIVQLFSWQQLETLIAGNPVFDISVWKAHTDAEGVPALTRDLFWRVLESLTPKEQSGFVRFAWGRSRLPNEKNFTTRMRLTDAGRATLPVSHTCFFSIELPAYETEAEMRRGLLTAIHFGVGGILMG